MLPKEAAYLGSCELNGTQSWIFIKYVLALLRSLSSLVSSRFPPHVVPHHPHSLHQTGIPHPAIVSPAIKQEPNGELSPATHT